jgi:hypothetical protein
MDRIAFSEPRRIAEVRVVILIWEMPPFAVITVVLFNEIFARELAHSPNLSIVHITVVSMAVLESESTIIIRLETGMHTTTCRSSLVVSERL